VSKSLIPTPHKPAILKLIKECPVRVMVDDRRDSI
jgi:hypothetical protein